MIETLLIAGLTCGQATFYGVGDGLNGGVPTLEEDFDYVECVNLQITNK